jgi:7-carboxy-7-deazaguanine synthase
MKKYPISEMFTSPQGEGLWQGTLMRFIRFAGCSVGKKLSPKDPFWNAELPIYTEKCCTYDGREFLCDTDFRTKEVKTMEEILAGVPLGVKHLCLTGGEPLNQPLAHFLQYVADQTAYMVHIETSGTVSLTDSYPAYCEGDSDPKMDGWLWITVSPKKGVLPEMIGLANEIKLLVDDKFDPDKLPEDVYDHDLVWIQPINAEFTVDRKNLDRCLQLLQEHPKWRLSTQMHKVWAVR